MAEKFEKKSITKKSKDISAWYIDVVTKAKFADYGPSKGTMVIRPYGYSLWEKIQSYFNLILEKEGIENAYFPSLIPLKFLEKEKSHVEGFKPELAVITHGGGEKLREPLVVRPTSETIIYDMFSKWLGSWRDLPIKINQWCNIVRWEKRTLPFIRTTEFLWQEGHTLHETEKEANDQALQALGWYKGVFQDLLAVPVIVGLKSESEKFAGGKKTYAVEALMPDGKALQAATTHLLNYSFTESFNVKYQSKEGKEEVPWASSWGLSTRALGALIMTHGDDNGAILPPSIAPVKVAIIPVLGKEDEKVLEFSNKVKAEIEKFASKYAGKVEVWDSAQETVGWKINEAELKGVPVYICIGPIEALGGPIKVKCRVPGVSELNSANIVQLVASVEKVLDKEQTVLFENAKKHLEKNTFEANSFNEFKKIMSTTRGFIKAFWCESSECENKIKEETKATTRVLPLNAKEENGSCIYCNKPSKHRWIFAQAY